MHAPVRLQAPFKYHERLMPLKHLALTPEALMMVDAIARNGSFAGAARELGRVPSALTYSVRQLEEALDVLLFDRRSGQARLTAAGQELLTEGRRLLAEVSGVANRVRRVATGWETEMTIAIDGVLSFSTVHDLVKDFYEHRLPAGKEPAKARPGRATSSVRASPRASKSSSADSTPAPPPPTRLRLRTEVLAGTWEALVSGHADLAIGVGMNGINPPAGFEVQTLGTLPFVLTLSPHHPLARAKGPIGDDLLMQHRAVAVADSASRLSPITVNLLPGQDVLTVATNEDKRQALIRGLGCGFLPEPFVRRSVEQGLLVTRAVKRPAVSATLGYAWRAPSGGDPAALGLALRWWLEHLARPATREALLSRHEVT